MTECCKCDKQFERWEMIVVFDRVFFCHVCMIDILLIWMDNNDIR